GSYSVSRGPRPCPSLSRPRLGPQHEWKDDRHRLPFRAGIHDSGPGCLSRELQQFREEQAAKTDSFSSQGRRGLAKKRRGPGGMTADSLWLALADLDPGSSQFDQPLEEIGSGAFPAGRVPERLPGLVRLPVIAVVPQVDSPQVGVVVLPTLR